VADAPFEHSRAAKLTAVRREEHELGDVTRSTLLDALELGEELRHRGRTLRRVARREDAGAAVERVHL